MRMEREQRQTDASLAEADDKVDAALTAWGVPTQVMDGLASFQREAVHFACNAETNDGRALIADEMGLGKTRTAIGCMCVFRSDWPVLIVCPSSARHHWRAELLALTCNVYGEGGKPYLAPQEVAIISYNLVGGMYDKLRTMDFNVLVVDESHYLKSGKAKRTQHMKRLADASKRCIMLSGTPALSRPMELFSQINMLQPHKWPDAKAFGRRYCRPQHRSAFSGASNTHELHLILTDSLMIRRLKKHVLSTLPPKTRHIVQVRGWQAPAPAPAPAPAAAEPLSDREALTVDEAVHPAEVDEVEARQARVNALMRLFSRSGAAKLPAVMRHTTTFLNDRTSGKVLVFAHHRVVLDRLSTFLSEEGHDFIRIDGLTPSSERGNLIQRFQTDGGVRVAVLAITAAGVGITLTAAATVFFAEMFWTPGSLIQAEDRAHRIGQTSRVQIKYFHAHDTVDEMLWPMVKEKMKALGEIVEGEAASLNAVEDASTAKVGSNAVNSSSSSSRRDSPAEARPTCETGTDSEAEAETEAETEAGAHADVSLAALDKDMLQELAISEVRQNQNQNQNQNTTKARTSVEDGAGAEGDVEGDEDEDDEEADAAAMGESDDEEPQPCPLARAYLEEQRVSKRKRKLAEMQAAASPYLPKTEKGTDAYVPGYGADGQSEMDSLLGAGCAGVALSPSMGGSSAPEMDAAEAAYLEEAYAQGGQPPVPLPHEVITLDDSSSEEEEEEGGEQVAK
eukprot:GSChrysophyteH2.ASY1.ANO1.1632.1 assembled CDS